MFKLKKPSHALDCTALYKSSNKMQKKFNTFPFYENNKTLIKAT